MLGADLKFSYNKLLLLWHEKIRTLSLYNQKMFYEKIKPHILVKPYSLYSGFKKKKLVLVVNRLLSKSNKKGRILLKDFQYFYIAICNIYDEFWEHFFETKTILFT